MKKKTEKVEMRKVPYALAVGSLMYAMVCTRSDIGYVGNLGREPWVVVTWILRYLRGTSSVCLQFGLSKPILKGFTNSDMWADVDTNRSTSRYVKTYVGGHFLWNMKVAEGCGVVNQRSEVHGCC
mgnify:FL=1